MLFGSLGDTTVVVNCLPSMITSLVFLQNDDSAPPPQEKSPPLWNETEEEEKKTKSVVILSFTSRLVPIMLA